MKPAAKKTSAPTPRFDYSPEQWRSLASFIADAVDELEVHIQAIDAVSRAEQREAIKGACEVAGNLRMSIADIRLHAEEDETEKAPPGARKSARKASR